MRRERAKAALHCEERRWKTKVDLHRVGGGPHIAVSVRIRRARGTAHLRLKIVMDSELFQCLILNDRRRLY